VSAALLHAGLNEPVEFDALRQNRHFAFPAEGFILLTAGWTAAANPYDKFLATPTGRP
jgi:hypothetical protein